MDLPSHSDADDPESGALSEPGHDRERSTATTVALGVLGAVVLIVIVLHLTGVVGPLAK